MWGIENYSGFIAAAIILNMMPGTDTIYIFSTTAAGGRKAGLASALGISTGIMAHTVLAALGLSLILAQSAAAFNAVKLMGAGYLIYIGVKTMRSFSLLPSAADKKQAQTALWQIYERGVFTNVLNPKVALFFLAFLPQFVAEDNSYGAVPFLLLGTTFFVTSTLWSVLLACCCSKVSEKLFQGGRATRLMPKMAGIIYILLGLNVLRT